MSEAEKYLEKRTWTCDESQFEDGKLVKKGIRAKVVHINDAFKGVRIAREEEQFKEVSKDGGFLYLTRTELNKRLDKVREEEAKKCLKRHSENALEIANDYGEQVEVCVREETIKEIKDWVSKEINSLEYQKDSILGISHYGTGGLDTLYEVKKFLVKSEVQKK